MIETEKTPEISVIMGIYNGEQYLKAALDSIASQSFQDWECIMIDDCSTDSTPEMLADYAKRDSRFRVFRNEKNMRLPASLNRAIGFARGTYIVRADADDISRKDRFEKQVQYMKEHPELDLSSANIFILQNKTIKPTQLHRKVMPEAANALFLLCNPVCHPTVICRKTSIEKLMYDPSFTYTEDLELWTRMVRAGMKFGFQDDYLLLYRMHDNQVSYQYSDVQENQYKEIITRLYRDTFQELSDERLKVLVDHIYLRKTYDLSAVAEFYRWMRSVQKEKVRQNKAVYTMEGIDAAMMEVLMSYRGQKEIGNKALWTMLSIAGMNAVRFLSARSGIFENNLKKAVETANLVKAVPTGTFFGKKIPIYAYDEEGE